LCDLKRDRGLTVISATHDMKMLDVSDRILWIRDGRIHRLEERRNLDIQVGGLGDSRKQPPEEAQASRDEKGNP
jgi:putative ABC transport system ATP-binding protein